MKPTPRTPKERPGTPRSRCEVKVGDGKFIHMRPLAEGLGLSPGGGLGFRVSGFSLGWSLIVVLVIEIWMTLLVLGCGSTG